MSRSGYVDDCDDNLAMGRWRGAVQSALRGSRGQALLRDLAAAMDAMEDKRLYRGSFATADGEFCALGALGAARGVKVDDLGDEEDCCEPEMVGQRFGIAPAMAAEIMYLNDEWLVDEYEWRDVVICGPMPPHHFPPYGHKRHERCVRVRRKDVPERRWKLMREWVQKQLLATTKS
jgi:hypothetical protein